MENENYLKEVREQYENYPYPKRNPQKEKERFYCPVNEELTLLNHYCFGGDMPLSKERTELPFRVLVAGGGTGDSAIALAEQLREFHAKIVYLDMSLSSMQVAQERAKIRNLDNIEWIHNSLLELPHMDIEKFDYINCSGVLHHLQSPSDGLKALKSVLKPQGAMCIMLYAPYGREAIYQVQKLMRTINKEEKNLQTQVENTKKILEGLPDLHGYKQVEDRWKVDVEEYGDIGVYDLFLHSQDRAYSVSELYELTKECGLNIIEFVTSENGGKVGYRPSSFIHDSTLLKSIEKLPKKEQESIAELSAGFFKKHIVYLSSNKYDTPIAQLSNLELVPYFKMLNLKQFVLQQGEKHPNQKIQLSLRNGGVQQRLTLSLSKEFLAIVNLIDGEKSLKEILQEIKEDNELLLQSFKPNYEAFFNFDLMLLKSKKFPSTLSPKALQERYLKNHV